MVRRFTSQAAARAITGMSRLEQEFGPLFTGALVVLLLMVVLAAVTQVGWLLGLAAVLALVMSVWVFRAGVEDVSAEPPSKPQWKSEEQHWIDTLAYYRQADPRRHVGRDVGRPHDGLASLRGYREQFDRACQEHGDDVPGDR